MRHNRTTLRHQGAAAVSVPAELAGVTVNADTLNSIGITVDLAAADDTDHNSTVAVEYKKSSSGTWKNALDLVRNDYEWFYNADNSTNESVNNFSGSIMFLAPATSYDIRLTYSDPQASDPQHDLVYETTVSTRAVPVKPTGGTTYYVEVGHGGTNQGTSANPWTSLATANSNVAPGDIVKIRNGTYTGVTILSTAGGTDNYIVWEPDTGHSPVIREIRLTASGWIWLDGLAVTSVNTPGTNVNDDTRGIYVPNDTTVDNVVITGCTITGFNWGIGTRWTPGYGGSNWTVMDNTISGNKPSDAGTNGPYATQSAGSGWGVSPNDGGAGNTVAYNTILRCGDGIGHEGDNDYYGNLIHNCSDDSFTGDTSYGNTRVWGNKTYNAFLRHMTFQPQRAGPWYFLYNQIRPENEQVFKVSVPDRMVFINNTILGNLAPLAFLNRCVTRNNIFMNPGNTEVWAGANQDDADDRGDQWEPGWNTDIDYDGWGCQEPTTKRFNYAGGTGLGTYATVALFYATVGTQQNGTDLDDGTNTFSNSGSGLSVSLELASGSDARGAGILVDNLSDWNGATPDLGCLQFGETAPHYGVRTSELSLALDQRTYDWTKH